MGIVGHYFFKVRLFLFLELSSNLIGSFIFSVSARVKPVSCSVPAGTGKSKGILLFLSFLC